MDHEDHYATLGVNPGAPPQVIRAAYVALSKLHHPDGGTEPDQRRMQDINRAWHVLRDPGRRAAYDATRAGRRPPAAPRRGPGTGGQAAGREGWGEATDGSGQARRHTGRAAPTDDPTVVDPAGGDRVRRGRGWGRSRREPSAGDDDTVPGDAASAGRAGQPGRGEERQAPGGRRGTGPGARTDSARRRRPGEDDTNPGGSSWDGEPFTPPQGAPRVDDEVDDVAGRHAGPGAAGWGEDVDPEVARRTTRTMTRASTPATGATRRP